MKVGKTFYRCKECDYTSSKWYGKCPQCQTFGTMEETVPVVNAPRNNESNRYALDIPQKAQRFFEMSEDDYQRFQTGSAEFDRVLGGGLVQGSVVLLCGEPGIGKSTLLMQISGAMNQNKKILYVSGEESGGQLKLRATRLGIRGEQLYILTETSLERIFTTISQLEPEIIVLDSIQTIGTQDITSTPGSITQVKETTLRFIRYAKNYGVSILIVGHVNKEGNIAGPKVLEHMVDAVLYFEGERQNTYRVIRAVKNRFGSTNEIGVFEMTEQGLDEVPNPSEMLLAGRPKNVSGCCALCTIEGTRPLIAEIQALVSPTAFPVPRRTVNGVDYNRMCLILAVLEKRLGMRFSGQDVYLNVVGGLQIDEPASDLAVAMALASSLSDKPLPDNACIVGEIGLSGECRAVGNIEQRINEAMRLGFKQILVPRRTLEKRPLTHANIEVVPVYGIYDSMKALGLLK